MRELPPTAGLPLQLQDLVSGLKSVILQRPNTYSFEELLADYLQFPTVDLYSSGTLCLSLAFEALKEMTGRNRVIIPAYTCPLVPIAAYAAGVEVILCDTQANSCELNLTILEQICDETVAAVVPTSIAGLPADILAVRNIARKASVFIVEDAAQSLGAQLNGRPVGYDADIAFYSLSVGKGLSLYDGGILAIRDAEIRQKVRQIANRRVKKQVQTNALRLAQLLAMWLLYNPTGLAWVYGRELRHWLAQGDLVRAVGEHFDLEIASYEFDQLRKNIGVSAILRLPEFLRNNRQRGLARRQILCEELGLHVLSEVGDSQGSSPFLLALTETTRQRDLIMERLWRSGLGVTRLFIHDLASYDYLRGIVPRQHTPNANSFASRSFSITNSHWLSDQDFACIVHSLGTVLQPAAQVYSFQNIKESLGGDRL